MRIRHYFFGLSLIAFLSVVVACGPQTPSDSTIVIDSNSPISGGDDTPAPYAYHDTRVTYERNGDDQIVYTPDTYVYQDPINYYQSVENLKGLALKEELYYLIRGHEKIHYAGISGNWKDLYRKIDANPANPDEIFLLYTGFLAKETQFDREHVWPKAIGFEDFNNLEPGTDLFNLHPSLSGINSSRGTLQFDNVDASFNNPYYHIRKSSTAFEPADESKGDIARTLFYLAVRYEGKELVNNVARNLPDLELYPEVNKAAEDDTYFLGNLETLLEWHHLDPVSPVEVLRNELIYRDYQHNRNPFIDHPEYAEMIFNANYDGPGASNSHPTSDTVTIPEPDSNIPVASSQYVFASSEVSGLQSGYANNHNVSFTVSTKPFFASVCNKSGAFTLGNNGNDSYIDRVSEIYANAIDEITTTSNASVLAMQFDVEQVKSVSLSVAEYYPAIAPNWTASWHGWHLLVSYDQGASYQELSKGDLASIDNYTISATLDSAQDARFAFVIRGVHPRMNITKIAFYN